MRPVRVEATIGVNVISHMGTYTRCDIALVYVLHRHLVRIIIVVLSARHTLSKVEEPTIRTVGRGGQVVGQVREAGVGRAAPMSQTVLVVTITTGPGLSGPASARRLSLCTVTIYPGHVVT